MESQEEREEKQHSDALCWRKARGTLTPRSLLPNSHGCLRRDSGKIEMTTWCFCVLRAEGYETPWPATELQRSLLNCSQMLLETMDSLGESPKSSWLCVDLAGKQWPGMQIQGPRRDREGKQAAFPENQQKSWGYTILDRTQS